MKLYIHIGLPKTGVTLLSYIFENSKNINFLGRPLIKPYEEIWHSMIFDSEKKYRTKVLSLKKKIILSLSKKKNNLLLIEGLTDPFFVLNSKKNFMKRLKILKKILDKVVQIKIIFTLRNQSNFFISRYVESPQYFEKYNIEWKNFNNFKKIFKKKKLNQEEKIFLNKFNYFQICKDLFKIFKKNNVSLFLYEDLKYNKKKYTIKISNLLNLNRKETIKIISKNQLNRATNINKKIYIRKNSQLNFILTNNKFYINFNKKIPLVIKLFLKKIFLIIDKSYYKILFNFKPEKKIYLNENDIKLIKKFYYKDNKNIDKYFKVGLKKNKYY